MPTDEATERYIERLLTAAPPLGPDQRALIVRVFGDTRVAAAALDGPIPRQDAA